jgi:hypothetical protein
LSEWRGCSRCFNGSSESHGGVHITGLCAQFRDQYGLCVAASRISFFMQNSTHKYIYYHATTHRAVVYQSSMMVQVQEGNSRSQGSAAGAQAGSGSGIELRDNKPAEKGEKPISSCYSWT